MRFLLRGENQEPYRPTECWLVSTGGFREVHNWRLSLEAPRDEGAQYERIDDFKQWMLFGDEDQRRFPIQITRTEYQSDFRGRRAKEVRVPDWRQYRRDDVLHRYLDGVLANAGAEEDARIWLLMPAIADDDRRKRYLDALRKVRPGIRVLPEPEMVIEYFRLVRRQLTLKRGHNNIFLVIDVGASTCNMTFVLGRRDEKVVDTSSRRRDQRLRAAHADSSEFAGRWVDDRLADRLGEDLGQHLPEVRRDLIRQIEKAKVRTSESGQPTALADEIGIEGMITRAMLSKVADDLWERLRPLYQDLAQRLYDQMSGTESAREKNAELFDGFGVRSGADIHRIIDTVILAGGTSQLPGFEDAMRRHLSLERADLTTLHVGPAFATAAAVGALAHVLHQHHRPSRLAIPEVTEDGGDANPARLRFDGTLSGDVVWRWGASKRSSVERGERVLLEAGDPFAFDGGRRALPDLPPWPVGAWLPSALAFQPTEGEDRRRKPRRHRLEVQRTPPSVDFDWDAEERIARLHSSDLGNVRALHLDLKRLDVERLEPASRQPGETIAPPSPGPGEIGLETAPDIIIDLGMSKTVVLKAESGCLDVQEFERSRGRRGFRSAGPPPVVGGEQHGETTRATVEATAEPLPEPLASTLTADPVEARAEARAVVEPRPLTAARPVPEPKLEPRRNPAPPEPASDGGRDEPAATSVPSPTPPLVDVSLEAFGERLAARLEQAPHLAHGDVVALVVALLTRPFVLLAGPPGCGKSTLVRTTARLLGLGTGFREVDVQAHWRDESWLEDPSMNLEGQHMLLLDEVNLTRPELYLWSLVNSLVLASQSQPDARRKRAMWICGTLNVDDMSRPPSPKVIDRSFLVEMDAPRWLDDSNPTARFVPDTFAGVSDDPLGRPVVGGDLRPSSDTWARITRIVESLRQTVETHHLRQDLLPSHRALSDVRAFLAIHEHLTDSLGGFLTVDDAIDRAVAGRILVKLAGATEQVEPVVDGLETCLADEPRLARCQRRLRLARAQCAFGFISPWQ